MAELNCSNHRELIKKVALDLVLGNDRKIRKYTRATAE
jgi:hypothetical protein